MKDEDDGLDENVYWEKVTAIATVATLITSTLVGFFGIYLGSQAIKLSGQVASAQMRPLLQAERAWFGADGNSGFSIENNGFGPLSIRQSVYVLFDDNGEIESSLVLAEGTTTTDVLEFLNLQIFTDDSSVTIDVPSVGRTLGINREISVIAIPEHGQRSQFYISQNEDRLDRVVRGLGVCIVYDALDKRRQLFSAKGACEALKITKRKFRLKKS